MSLGVDGMRCCRPLCHAEVREELPSVAGAQEWAPECSQMEPGKGTAVTRRGHCSCLETKGTDLSGESNHSWMTSTWKFFLSTRQRFSLSRLLSKAFIPFFSSHFSLLVPSASPQPAFPDASHVGWRAVLQ